MITLIKVIHSAIFFAMAASLGLIAWAAVTGQPSRITWAAVALLIVEVGAVALARGDCPLTLYAERLGASSGSVVDLFLPRWLADRAFVLGGSVFLVSLLVLSLRLALRAAN
jgi:hypothetical protein